jgi:hypothetical protein
VVVPFMEFALPFAIRLFPNLLPSTFEEGHVREEKRMRLLKVRIGVAKVRTPGGGAAAAAGRAGGSGAEVGGSSWAAANTAGSASSVPYRCAVLRARRAARAGVVFWMVPFWVEGGSSTALTEAYCCPGQRPPSAWDVWREPFWCFPPLLRAHSGGDRRTLSAILIRTPRRQSAHVPSFLPSGAGAHVGEARHGRSGTFLPHPHPPLRMTSPNTKAYSPPTTARRCWSILWRSGPRT